MRDWVLFLMAVVALLAAFGMVIVVTEALRPAVLSFESAFR
jgi:hypothetical protein